MRYGSIPSWVYIMLVVMGAGFIAGAGAFYFLAEGAAGKIVGPIWLAMGGGMVIFSLRALAKRTEDDRIARSGTPATATLLNANSTGWVVNNMPQWALQLRIDGYGAPYETTIKMLTYDPPPNGATFSVRIDPARREHVVLAADDANNGAASSAPATTAAGANVSPQVEAALLAALQRAGLTNAGTTAVTNPDGSHTITSTTFTVDGGGTAADTNAPQSAAETVKLLADLERMHANGTLGDAEFDSIKRRLLGES